MDEKVTVTPLAPGYPAPPPSYQQPRRGFLGCFALVAGLGLAFSLLLNLALLGARSGGSDSVASGLGLHEKLVMGEGDDKVVAIQIEGIIAEHQGGGGLFGATAAESLPHRIKEQLDRAKGDEQVKAVILEVNSPGGTVSASDEIWNYLVQFRDSSKKPLVVHQAGLAASGGYYISAAGDEIVCEPTVITGSIGVILGGYNFAELLEKYGVKDVSITSGPNKDLLNPAKPVKKEHQEILQSTVDDMYERFVDVVASGIAHRKQVKKEDIIDDVKKLADGRIYTPKQALELKLIDKIGYLEDAFAEAKGRAHVKDAKLIRYTKQPTFLELLSGNTEGKLDLAKGLSVRIDGGLLDELATPRPLVLWRGE